MGQQEPGQGNVARRALSPASPRTDLRRRCRQPADPGRQPARPQGADPVLRGSGQVHLHRPAIQHPERVRALRRQAGAQPVAVDDVPAPGAFARIVGRGWLDLGDHRRQRGALPQGVDGRGVRAQAFHRRDHLAEAHVS